MGTSGCRRTIWFGSIISLSAGAAKEVADELGFFKSAGASAKDAVADLLGILLAVLGDQASDGKISKELVNRLMSILGHMMQFRTLKVSVDLSTVDLDIAFSFIFCVGATTNAYSNLAVLAIVTWLVLFVSIPMVLFAIHLQRYYFATAKELMQLNGTTKSLVANHLAESIAGSMTIRAFEEEDQFFVKNLDLIDVNATPFFHSFAANEWLIQQLETLTAVVLSSSVHERFIGMALSYGLLLNMSFVMSIQNQCTLANYIIYVERLNQYMHIPSEAPEVIEENRSLVYWLTRGKVEIQDLQEPVQDEEDIIKFCEETGLPVALDETIENVQENSLGMLAKFTHSGVVVVSLMARWAQ
ncbi:unnamed protein product [Camellia sinensis]